MDVTIANQEVRENFVVDYGNHKDHLTSAAVANVDNVNNKHNEVVYLNQSGNRIYDAKYFSTVQNGTFIPNDKKVYEVLDDSVLVDSFNPDLNGPAVKDVTSEFTPKYSLNNTRVDIDLNRSNMNKGKRYIITQAVKPSGTGNVTTNYELTRYGNQESRYPTGTKSTTVSYINGSSTAQGDNPTYSLGDYVWLDKTKMVSKTMTKKAFQVFTSFLKIVIIKNYNVQPQMIQGIISLITYKMEHIMLNLLF